MGGDEMADSGSPLRNSLWNLLYHSVASTDHSRTAWASILRGTCRAFFKEAIDDLPASDNEASRRGVKRRFFELSDHRVYDLFEFLLTDDRSALKEVDRKLVRRGVNRILEEEGAPVRFLRDRFVPLPDDLGLDAVASAEEALTLFDLAAASRHMESAVAFLSRRPEPAGRDAVREAILAVAAVVNSLRDRPGDAEGGEAEGGGARPARRIAIGAIEPISRLLGIDPALSEAVDAALRRMRSLSGLPAEDGSPGPAPARVDPAEASFMVVFAASVVRLLLSRARPDALPAGSWR